MELFEQFVKERRYLKNVPPSTEQWCEYSWRALGLRREDVDLDNLMVRVLGKGGKYRQVPMSLELRRCLFRWLSKAEGTFVFGTRQGTRQRQRNALRDF